MQEMITQGGLGMDVFVGFLPDEGPSELACDADVSDAEAMLLNFS